VFSNYGPFIAPAIVFGNILVGHFRYNVGMPTATHSVPSSTIVGYARVSTLTQTLEQQTEQLAAAGAAKIFSDVMSGAREDRPGFGECLRYLREGDTLVVWRLDRLGRNMRSIINTLNELTERGVTVRSLHDGVDTSTSTGRMVAGIMMSIAEYERELVRERTALKLEHARKIGVKFGRPAKLDADQAALARRMKDGGETAATICKTLGIGRTTLYRYLALSD
jgi:DNA invertase Pin-like site-specific DNA recombinase